MAREIILLTTTKGGDGVTAVSGVNWFSIPAVNAQVPIPGFKSAAAGVTGTNAITTQEQANLEAGATLEEFFSLTYSTTFTKTQIQADLVARWTARNTAIQSLPATRQFFGVSFDSTTGWNG